MTLLAISILSLGGKRSIYSLEKAWTPPFSTPVTLVLPGERMMWLAYIVVGFVDIDLVVRPSAKLVKVAKRNDQVVAWKG